MIKSINELDRLDEKIKNEIKEKVNQCIDSGWYILGENVKKFEKDFANYLKTKYCVAVANGTEALEIALKVIEIKDKDEVITVANAGFYSSVAILECGATPVYVDINPTDYLINKTLIKSLINSRTKALIITHLFGKMVDMTDLVKLCKDNNIFLIEDCAQAHGAEINGKKAGTYGDIGCFSFYPTKNLGAFGDAGAIVTNDDFLYERIKMLRQYGWENKYQVVISNGINSRMDEMQACVLNVKLKYLDTWNERRRNIANLYSSMIKSEYVINKPKVTGKDYVAHLYVIEVKERDKFIKYLKLNSIPYDIHYPVPDHKQKIMIDRYKNIKLPVTESVSSRIITLPCFPEMTDEEVKFISLKINDWRP